MTGLKIHFSSMGLNDIRLYAMDPVDGRVQDISQGGMALLTTIPLQIGQQYHFRVNAGESSVSLDGEVVRCNVNEMAEDMQGEHFPLYLNGVRFLIKRNPLEISLLEILHHNLHGERRSSPRVKPDAMMPVEIAHPLICTLDSVDTTGIQIRSEQIPDMDEERELLLQAGYETLRLNTRVVHVSKKDGEPTYMTRMEFMEHDEHSHAAIEGIVAALSTAP